MGHVSRGARRCGYRFGSGKASLLVFRPLVRQLGRLPEWPKGAVCKTVGSAYVGSNPTPATTSARDLDGPGPSVFGGPVGAPLAPPARPCSHRFAAGYGGRVCWSGGWPL